MQNDKTASIKWAIEELSKQKEEIEGKLSVARKRDETSELITEVLAQKDALQKRISALEDGLKVSSDLVQTPVSDLESQVSTISEKIEIAQERLENLEQEAYFEELGRNLNGKVDDDTPLIGDEASENEEPLLEDIYPTPLSHPEEVLSSNPKTSDSSYPAVSTSTQTSAQTETMKSTKSRIQATENTTLKVEGSRLPVEESKSLDSSDPVPKPSIDSVPVENLEETASKLGVDTDFLIEKSTQAVLRMIARNGGKLTFPLEVEQIDL